MAEKDRTDVPAALLVIDAQESFKATPRWNARSNASFETNVSALIEAFRSARQPVIYVLHSDEDEGFHTSSPHYRLMDFLSVRDGEPILHKTTRNAFTSTDLQPRLLRAGVRRIVVAGIQTEQCCETTARVGADLGFDVDFVTEATMTFPIPHPSGGMLPVEQIVERTEYVLRNRFARIVTVSDVVDSLRVPAGA